MFNLLTEPLIRIDTSRRGRIDAWLPEVYAALMAEQPENQVIAFPALRPHQRHPWHAFLVQLGAMAMHRGEVEMPPTTAAEWLTLIRGLTPDYPDDEPWHLVVEDITKPAFMQPPARSPERENDYQHEAATPDEVDMLVASKNHDLKKSVARRYQIDDWIFALVALQTMDGYGGAKNYGISRMPSGYGNRPAFSITPSESVGVHVRRDLMALLEHRPMILGEYPMYSISDSGICMVSTQPWDGEKSEGLLPGDLDPFYIEICRRIRLHQEPGRLYAVRATSSGRRIIDMKGLTGDPWAPVSNNTNPKGTPPAFLGPRRFGYERVIDGLTSPDWKQPALLRIAKSDKDYYGDMQLVARGMVRGEGGTNGYHERVIPLTQKTIQAFGRVGGFKELGDLARERIEQIGTVKSILRHAVATFATWGDSERTNNVLRSRAQDNLLRKKVDEWAYKLDEIVDAEFFDHLQTEFESDEEERQAIRNTWLRNGKDGVVDHASNILRDAENTLPSRTIHSYRALVQADSVFWGRLHGPDGLPFLFRKS